MYIKGFMDINDSLKECPFCGQTARIVGGARRNGEVYYFVKCFTCGARTRGTTETEAHERDTFPVNVAIELWNNRADKQKIETRVYTSTKEDM